MVSGAKAIFRLGHGSAWPLEPIYQALVADQRQLDAFRRAAGEEQQGKRLVKIWLMGWPEPSPALIERYI